MAFTLVSDDLWQEIEPLLPRKRASRKGGRPTADNRSCLLGIVFVLRTGCPWNLLPFELGGVSGVTCWRRFSEWTTAGVWPEVHQRLLNRLGRLGHVNLDRAVIDSASVRAVFGGSTPAQTPRIAAKRAVNAT